MNATPVLVPPLPMDRLRIRRFVLSAILGLLGLLALPGHALQRFVDPSNPAAQDVGFGSLAMPYRTLTFAMSQLQPGDHLVIAQGTYRRSWPMVAGPR